MVVFDNKKTVTVGGRNLRVQTFKSNKPAELQAFVEKAYSKNSLTTRTVLYEAMLAGLDLISKMPATEPRFMVVFSDGEDLNSAFKREDVLKAAQRLNGFNAYAIDYMESKETDKFLTTFATQNRGQIWKAESETNLVSIFQNVASKMQYYYVVSYDSSRPRENDGRSGQPDDRRDQDNRFLTDARSYLLCQGCQRDSRPVCPFRRTRGNGRFR